MTFRLWRDWSIHSKLFALLFVVLFGSSLLVFQVTTMLTQQAIRDFMYQYLYMNQEKTQTGFDFLLGEMNMLSVRLLTQADIYRISADDRLDTAQKESQIRAVLDGMSFNRDTVGAIVIQTRDAAYAYGAGDRPEPPDAAFLEKIEGSSTNVWSQVRKDKYGHAYLLLGSRYLNFATGQRIGYLLIYVKERALYRVFKDMVPAGWGDSLLLADDRYVVSAGDETQAGSLIYDRSFFEVGAPGYKAVKLDGGNVIVSNYPLRGSVADSGLNWRIVSLVSADKLFAKVNAIKRYSYALQALLVIVTLLVSWYVSKRIVNPVNRLTRNIRKFGRNSTVIPYSSGNTNDELILLENSFNEMVLRINGLIENINETKDRQRESELIALQAQINPHFLYNTLDAIGWLAKLNDQKDIEKMIVEMARFYRLSLHKGEQFILVQEEIGIIRSYIALEEMRFPDKFSTVYDISEDILSYRVLKIVLQPLVENAIKHGISYKNDMGLLTISGCREGGDLLFEVRDDGIGFDVEQMKREKAAADYRGGGYGILNVDARIKLEYGPDYGIFIESESGRGTVARVRLKAYA